MRYVRLGKTELEVSAIAFGTWAFGGDWGSFDAHESRAAIHHALDLGVTFFDTAQAYGFGVSERLLADALWERARRDEVIVATKGGLRMEGQTLLRDASARWLRQGAESSLRNLRTDYIDLYQVHWPTRERRRRRRRGSSRTWCGRARSGTSASRITTPSKWTSSLGTGEWRRFSRRTTCSAATSRGRSCPTQPSTTSVCSSTARSPTDCSRGA